MPNTVKHCWQILLIEAKYLKIYKKQHFISGWFSVKPKSFISANIWQYIHHYYFYFCDKSITSDNIYQPIYHIQNTETGLEPHINRWPVLNDSVWDGAKNLHQHILLVCPWVWICWSLFEVASHCLEGLSYCQWHAIAVTICHLLATGAK